MKTTPAPPPPLIKQVSSYVTEDLSKVFEEAEARLEEILTESAAVTPRTTPAAAYNGAQDSLRNSQTQRRYGTTKRVVVGVAALTLLIALGVFVVLRRSSDPANTSANTSDPTKRNAEKQTTNEPPPGMVYVTGGEFIMGSNSGDEYSKPTHKETIKPFYIDITEVTNEQYKRFIDATNHKIPPDWVNGTFPAGKSKYPVTGVTWDDVSAFAKWAGKRLPTEEEWEFAARGTDGRIYPWGSEWIPELANADKQSNGMTEVASRQGKSPFGCFDMSGNAFEWTNSAAKAYPNGKPFPSDRADPKILRGGYFGSAKAKATTTFRVQWGARTEQEYSNTSFRCAKDSP